MAELKVQTGLGAWLMMFCSRRDESTRSSHEWWCMAKHTLGRSCGHFSNAPGGASNTSQFRRVTLIFHSTFPTSWCKMCGGRLCRPRASNCQPVASDLRVPDSDHRFPRISSAANSPIIKVGALVFAVGIWGMMEASAIRSPVVPYTFSRLSTTASLPVPMAQVPTG